MGIEEKNFLPPEEEVNDPKEKIDDIDGRINDLEAEIEQGIKPIEDKKEELAALIRYRDYQRKEQMKRKEAGQKEKYLEQINQDIENIEIALIQITEAGGLTEAIENIRLQLTKQPDNKVLHKIRDILEKLPAGTTKSDLEKLRSELLDEKYRVMGV